MSRDDEKTALPSYTRRQQTGTSTARSLLLTVFGEYVLPQGRPVWTSTLLQVLAGLDIEEKSARQALTGCRPTAGSSPSARDAGCAGC